MNFSEMIGNDAVVHRLKECVQKDNPFHAYLFEGPAGVGKRLAAETFAQGLLCEDPREGEPCGICSGCKKFMSGNHSDYHFITTDGKSVKDQQIEELQKQAAKKPFDGDRSIFIIEHGETMTERAQNRLLKTLEEPSGKSVLILLTENIDAILPTILSRCVILRFKPVAREILQEYLTEACHVSRESAAMAAAYAYGSVGRGRALLSDEAFQKRRERSIRCAEFFVQRPPLALFSREIQEVTNKEEAIELLDMMEYWFRDALFLLKGASQELLLNRDCILRLRRMLEKETGGEKWLCEMIEKVEQAKADITMNVKVGYVLKNMFLE